MWISLATTDLRITLAHYGDQMKVNYIVLGLEFNRVNQFPTLWTVSELVG